MLTQAFRMAVTPRDVTTKPGADWFNAVASMHATEVLVSARPASVVEDQFSRSGDDALWVPCEILEVRWSRDVPPWAREDWTKAQSNKRPVVALARVSRERLMETLPGAVQRVVRAAELVADGVSRIPGAISDSGEVQAEATRAVAAATRAVAGATLAAANVEAGAMDRATDRAARAASAQIMSEYATSSRDAAWLAMGI